MGFGDKLKGLRDQAQQAVTDNRDKIQGAVQVVGETANTRTHGKYATKIAKVGEKVGQSVDKFATEGSPAGADPAASGDSPAAAATWETAAEPGTPAEPGAYAEPGTPAEPGAYAEPGTPAEPGTSAEPKAPPEFE
jgi:surface protein G